MSANDETRTALEAIPPPTGGPLCLQPFVDWMKANGVRRFCIDEIEIELAWSPGGPVDVGQPSVVTSAKGFAVAPGTPGE